MKNEIESINPSKKEETTNNDILSSGNENDVLKYILEKAEENTQSSFMLKKEMLELKIDNNKLNYEINRLKFLLKNQANLMQKILMKSNENRVQRLTKNIKGLKDLFNRYLYYLKIYTPYVNVENIIKLRNDKRETQNTSKISTDTKMIKEVPINNIAFHKFKDRTFPIWEKCYP